ncbi:hypothetical protein K3495_g12454 [Podosphaera aphanis]|nr:hypothetical protein K3495_g12454 [Podosphaera aphanis]
MKVTLEDNRQDLEVVLLANLAERNSEDDKRLDERFLVSEWYRDVAEYLINRRFSATCATKVQRAALIRKVANVSVSANGDLYYDLRGKRKKCLIEDEVASVIAEAHDNGGHFSQAITLKKLKNYYWPRMAIDVKDYILGCLVCGKYGTALRSQSRTRVTVREPMELLGIDFVGPFPTSAGTTYKWILVAIDYFSRYVWAEPTQRNDSDTVIEFLKTSIIDKFGSPVGMYMDPGPHFGDKTRKFAEGNGIVWCNSPVAAKRAVGMIEKAVDLIQRVLKKVTNGSSNWAQNVPTAVLEANKREIQHLLYSPATIMLGFNPVNTVEIKFPTDRRRLLAAGLSSLDMNVLPSRDEHSDGVVDYITRRMRRNSEVLKRSDKAKDRSAERHNLGIRGQVTYAPGELVMLYDHRQVLEMESRRVPDFLVLHFV